MKITKENNQYYGQFFEEAIASILKGEEVVNNTSYSFTKEEIEEMTEDATKAADLFAKKYSFSDISYCGRSTFSMDADLIVDGKSVEIKYVSGGNGTYLNTSLQYFEKRFGFVSYAKYLEKEVLPYLEQFFGKSVYEGASPVTMKESKEFRHNSPEAYKELQKIEKVARKEYVTYLYEEFSKNSKALATFLGDVISKNACSKSQPNILIVFNHNTKEVKIIGGEAITASAKGFRKTACGLVFDNIRVQIGWQNGTGLNNPTMRAFIK